MVIPEEREWTDWTVIYPGFTLTERVLQELLIGGQTFQWHRIEGEPPLWIGLLNGQLLQLKIAESDEVSFRGIDSEQTRTSREHLARWFRVDEDYEKMLATLPLSGDPYLNKCIESFPGLRILRQPIEEVLLTFLCSSNKQISQIKRMLQELSRRWGNACCPGWYSYPSWEVLGGLDLEELGLCGTGYRAKYILGSARQICGSSGYFEYLKSLNYADAKSELIKLPGVGPKVADCILLYGGGFYESFPLDTWILKAMDYRYGKANSSKKEMGAFISDYFGPFAGIAQQFIFAYEREVRELVRGRTR
jgi:N-glycosylase/DNA lyase